MKRLYIAIGLGGLLAGAALPGHSQGFVAPGQNGPPQAVTLPDGIDHVYALEGSNALLLFGTQQGYETTREIVKALDGDLALTRTEVTYARATPEFLAALGVTVPVDGLLSAGDVQKLVDARRAGRFAGTATLRITSREEYQTEGLLGGGVSALPLTEATEVGMDGRLVVTLRQPVQATVALGPGQMSVVAVPPTGSDAPVSLLFVTASVLYEAE